MAFVASFGVNVGLTIAISVISSLIPPAQRIQCKVGVGSQTRDSTGPDLSGGQYPELFLYDTRGTQFTEDLGGSYADPASNEITVFQGSITTTPEYMKIQAGSSDAICVSYMSLTSAANDQRTWHAGYVKQCADIANDDHIWYPSPEIIPGTDFRPGCVWLSSDDRFLQAISFKLTDFGFPDSQTATIAQSQYTQFPNTLCQAPARMTMWKTTPTGSDGAACIPYYDFDVEKNTTTGFDLDFQKIVDGHTLKCDVTGATTFNQVLQPGQGPQTLTPQQIIDAQAAQAAADEAGTSTNGPPPASGNFGGTVGSLPIPETPPSKRSNTLFARPREMRERSRDILARREYLKKERDYCVDRLVISHLKDHSATEVCETASSWGPDFVSMFEGVYCDMCERELWQLCDDSTTQYCFDLEKKVLRYPRHVDMREEQVDLSKKFKIVDEWK